MTKPLHVLIVEDSKIDAELLLRELRQGGYDPVHELVDSAEAMNAALNQQGWEIIISDYVMPRFSGPDALRLAQARGIDVPIIVVSGQMGEETAVETMKAGAHDYIVKGSLSRLVPAVERELREAAVRRERREADAALKIAHEELRRAHAELSEAHAVLEQRVAERTADLAEANRDLQAEIAERKQMEKEREELLEKLREANSLLTIASVQATEKAQEAEERSAELQRLGDERERLLEELQTERALLQAVFQQMPAGVLVAEASSGKMIITNEQVSSILQAPLLPAADIEQYSRNLGFHADGTPYRPDEWPLLRSILKGEVVSGEEIEFERSDGTRGVAAHNSAPIRDRKGRIVAGVLIFHDITERKQAERLREEYLHLISHDLRNPLTGLMGHAQLLARSLAQQGLEPEAGRAEHVLYNARRMNEMIQDLVESSRLESGQLELHKDTADLLDLMSSLSQRIGTQEDQQRINVVSSEWVPPVAVDLSRIERAFTNVISNALKYSSAQAPVLVEVAREDGDAVVCVRDRGVGIAADDLPHLFQRFYRAKTGYRQEGIGLGLYIARLIIEAHGGRIWVDSEVGKGSAFYVALPVA
ncbi:MAG: response regulator [Chloroflexi bacterium]|nr:response regulator [Chloroflexota bacterium]